jgi:hypothetical protein
MAQKKAAKKSDGHGMEIGLALAGIATVAGAVFLYGTDAGKKKRKQIKGWTLKAKGEVVEKLEKLKEINEESYNKVVDAVIAKYAAVKTIAPEELAEVVADLRKSWKHIVAVTKTKKPAPRKKAASKPKTKTAAKPAAKSKAKKTK